MAEITVDLNPRFLTEFAPEWAVFANGIAEEISTRASRRPPINWDTGNLAGSISARLEAGEGAPLADAVIEAFADYALFQELEPNESTEDGSFTRQRRGGSPYLRPALMEVLSKRGLL